MRRAILKEMMENPMAMMPQMMGQEIDNNTFDSPEILVAEPDDLIIDTATPLSLTTNKLQQGTIATLSWLCKTRSGELITISSNYLLDIDEEELILNQIPFHSNNLFVSNKLLDNMILTELPGYISDLSFSPVEDINNETEFTMETIDISSNHRGSKVLFTVSSELFASFCYMDNYICENIVNNYEITLAIISASKVPVQPTKCVVIDSVSSIINIASAGKKSTSVAVVYEVKHDDETTTLLTPFDIGVKLPRSKFKGNTIEKLENTFLNDADQFLSIFMFDTRIKSLDKEYLVIKAKNKNEEIKLFFMDNKVRQQLEDMIRDY